MMTRQTAGVFIGITLSILLASCSSQHGNETIGDEDRKYIETMRENDPPAKTIPPSTPKER